MRPPHKNENLLFEDFQDFLVRTLKTTRSFHDEKFSSVSFLEKDLFEVSFGVHIGEKRLEVRWDGSPSPERTRLSLLDLFLQVLRNRLQLAGGGRERHRSLQSEKYLILPSSPPLYQNCPEKTKAFRGLPGKG